MQQAVLELYPNAVAEYEFIARKKFAINDEFIDALMKEIGHMTTLRLSDREFSFISKISFLKPSYIEYLKNYKFNADQVEINTTSDFFTLKVKGFWHEAIMWEVPLLALISENYFKIIDKNWTMESQKERFIEKVEALNCCIFSEFGTRRRRNFATQDLAVEILKTSPNFVGTSNVYLAMQHNVKPMGTMAHEWIQAHSALESLRHANRYALHAWQKVYQGQLGTALSDTYGSDAFLGDFDAILSRLYDGTRQDSGDPFEYTDKIVAHYKRYNIDPLSKIVLFSDNLNCYLCQKLRSYCKNKILPRFGIGTHFTNDFDNSPALNIVLKMTKCNNIPVVKLSDVPTKSVGDRDALRVANWTFHQQPLDQ